MTTQVVGYGRFLFVILPKGGIDAELSAAIDDLGSSLENMHEVEAPRSGVQAGRFQLLRAEPGARSGMRLAASALAQASCLIRLEAASLAPLWRTRRTAGLIVPRGGSIETLAGVQRPRSYYRYAMTQFAYTPALPPRSGRRLPLGW
jgi:hypothetical protein